MAAEICSINFPARPGYMGRERYDRLRQLHSEASQRALSMFAVQLQAQREPSAGRSYKDLTALRLDVELIGHVRKVS